MTQSGARVPVSGPCLGALVPQSLPGRAGAGATAHGRSEHGPVIRQADTDSGGCPWDLGEENQQKNRCWVVSGTASAGNPGTGQAGCVGRALLLPLS